MFQAKAGDVFAVRIDAASWGIVRFYRGLQMCVPRYVLRVPGLPAVDWLQAQSDCWHFFSFAPDDDRTEAVHIGVVPFSDTEKEWGPPVYDPPDAIQNCFVIHHRGGMIKTKNPKDIAGMSQSVRITPARLSAFFADKLARKELNYTE
jgi:hypothetical protein